jgi:hypothetical protein
MNLLIEGDIIDVLKSQHQDIRRAFDEVTAVSGAERAAAFARLDHQLVVHEASEQQVLHPRLQDPSHAQIAADRVAEERAASEALNQLRALGVDDPDFPGRFAALRDAVLTHARHEEDEEFPELRRTQPREQLFALGNELRAVQTLAD